MRISDRQFYMSIAKLDGADMKNGGYLNANVFGYDDLEMKIEFSSEPNDWFRDSIKLTRAQLDRIYDMTPAQFVDWLDGHDLNIDFGYSVFEQRRFEEHGFYEF